MNNEQNLKEKFKQLYSGIIYDTMKFDLNLKNFIITKSAGPIIPVWNFKGNIFGRAFTAKGEKTNNPNETIIRSMLDNLDEGCVYILQANDNSRAHFGDITASFIKRAKCEGAIIQGWTRDISQIEELGVKLWCKGIQPQDSIDRWHIVDYNCEICIDNIFITPLDYIFADKDSIIVIPGDIVENVANLALERKEKENIIRNEVLHGSLSATDIFKKLGRW